MFVTKTVEQPDAGAYMTLTDVDQKVIGLNQKGNKMINGAVRSTFYVTKSGVVARRQYRRLPTREHLRLLTQRRWGATHQC